MTQERRIVHYSGIVQGVGFRWNAARALQGRPVTGYVRNLRDGRVQLLLEGEAGTLDDALQAVRDRLQEFIQREEAEVSPPTGEFNDFAIRR